MCNTGKIKREDLEVMERLEREIRVDKDHPARPYLELLQYLWPGDWRKQLELWNAQISKTNMNLARNSYRNGFYPRKHSKRSRNKRLVSESEFWVFIGILLSASFQQTGGEKLWETEATQRKRGVRQHLPAPDFGARFMPKTRFDELRKTFPFAFGDLSKSDPDDTETFDPWWPILGLLDGFNKNRRKTVASSRGRTADESMSAADGDESRWTHHVHSCQTTPWYPELTYQGE